LKIKEFEIKKVDISKIKFDKTNPNIVTPEQMRGLEKAIKKFGYLVPVVLNKKFQILDGEHRVRAYQKLKVKEIPSYVIDVDKFDGKILRQVMNKLKGTHDPMKDVSEFELLLKNEKLGDLAKILAVPENRFLEALEVEQHANLAAEEWKDMPEFMQDAEDIYRKVIFTFDTKKAFDKFMKHNNIDYTTDKTKSIRIPYRPKDQIEHIG
jgi:ParB-like chromosome segregation protein Spo0J